MTKQMILWWKTGRQKETAKLFGRKSEKAYTWTGDNLEVSQKLWTSFQLICEISV
jgi:hypothetical protein